MPSSVRMSLLATALAALMPVAAGAQTAPTAPQGAFVVPQPDPVFGGVIGRTAQESRPDFPAEPRAPQGAPNVLLIMLDDVGYGQFGTFGGLTPTPALDALGESRRLANVVSP